ncbi:MAG: HDOD domain-containing protein, partial [Verrucomicrobiota bacterium]
MNPSPKLSPELRTRIDACPMLGSLRSINDSLHQLINSDHSMLSEIAEVTNRDPSMASRMLRLANSPFYALPEPVASIQDAILLLGMRQVRELILAAPVIEDLTSFGDNAAELDWDSFWAHSLGTAIITRELLTMLGQSSEGEIDYLAGLLHNVGKIVMHAIMPETAPLFAPREPEHTAEVLAKEIEICGCDHAAIGAYYLKKHNLPKPIVAAVRHHNDPAADEDFPRLSAAVHVADNLVRSVGVFCFNNEEAEEALSSHTRAAWQALDEDPESPDFDNGRLMRTVERLPGLLQRML